MRNIILAGSVLALTSCNGYYKTREACLTDYSACELGVFGVYWHPSIDFTNPIAQSILSNMLAPHPVYPGPVVVIDNNYPAEFIPAQINIR